MYKANAGKLLVQDDRTKAEKLTHDTLIVARDTFLSGWGKAENGTSYAAWACKPDDIRKVTTWVSNRSDMVNVRKAMGNYLPGGHGHFHIYVVDDKHPALE